MKSKCEFCNRTRTAFIWIVVFGIILNSAFKLLYSTETLSVFEIMKVPLAFCILALLIKILINKNN
jgi:hypothetical protein